MAKDPTNLPNDPPNDPPPNDPPPVREPRAGRGCSCGFCDCRLTADGDVLRMSDTAKGYVLMEDELKTARAELKKTRDELAALDEKLKALQKPERGSSVRDGLRLGG